MRLLEIIRDCLGWRLPHVETLWHEWWPWEFSRKEESEHDLLDAQW